MPAKALSEASISALPDKSLSAGGRAALPAEGRCAPSVQQALRQPDNFALASARPRNHGTSRAALLTKPPPAAIYHYRLVKSKKWGPTSPLPAIGTCSPPWLTCGCASYHRRLIAAPPISASREAAFGRPCWLTCVGIDARGAFPEAIIRAEACAKAAATFGVHLGGRGA